MMHATGLPLTMLCMNNEARKKQVDWIDAILAATGWSATTLARNAKLHASTLSKFRKADGPATLTSNTVSRIAAISPLPPYETFVPNRPRGIARLEVQKLSPDSVTSPMVTDMLESATSNRNSLEIWVLQSRALELVGYMPGDYLFVDLAARPKPGDAVCVKFPKPRPGDPDAIIRLYEKPFLVSATLDKDLLHPLLIDESHLEIAGVIVGSVRATIAA